MKYHDLKGKIVIKRIITRTFVIKKLLNSLGSYFFLAREAAIEADWPAKSHTFLINQN